MAKYNPISVHDPGRGYRCLSQAQPNTGGIPFVRSALIEARVNHPVGAT